MDSFRPLWGWHEDPKLKKKSKKASSAENAAALPNQNTAESETLPKASIDATGVDTGAGSNGSLISRNKKARVEEVEDE